MRITALVAIAMAMSILAVQPATADPEKRNHGVNKRQQDPKDQVRQDVKSDEPKCREQPKQAGEEILEEKPDGQPR